MLIKKISLVYDFVLCLTYGFLLILKPDEVEFRSPLEKHAQLYVKDLIVSDNNGSLQGLAFLVRAPALLDVRIT